MHERSRRAANDARASPSKRTGDFYVEHGCCLSCDVPREIAPDHFEYDEHLHCFVARQPSNPSDVSLLIRVVWEQDLGCIRYAGTDPEILKRIAENGRSDCCDALPPEPH